MPRQVDENESSPLRDLTFVTRSDAKVLETERILGCTIRRVNFDLPEIQAVELEQVVRRKAEDAYRALGQRPVLVEESGLFLDAWNGLPGALVRWFEETVGAEGICRMLDSFSERGATARTGVAVHDGSCRVFVGEARGMIAARPRGTNGFGWDTIFVPAGATRTFAEMESEEKDRLSMRRMALEALAAAARQESE